MLAYRQCLLVGGTCDRSVDGGKFATNVFVPGPDFFWYVRCGVTHSDSLMMFLCLQLRLSDFEYGARSVVFGFILTRFGSLSNVIVLGFRLDADSGLER